jgi:hypothetical protein
MLEVAVGYDHHYSVYLRRLSSYTRSSQFEILYEQNETLMHEIGHALDLQSMRALCLALLCDMLFIGLLPTLVPLLLALTQVPPFVDESGNNSCGHDGITPCLPLQSQRDPRQVLCKALRQILSFVQFEEYQVRKLPSATYVFHAYIVHVDTFLR